jgi:PAS domain S-box-containing protein
MQHMLGGQQLQTTSFVADQINQELETRFQILNKVAGIITPSILGKPLALQALLEERLILQGPFNGDIFVTGLDGVSLASLPLSAEGVSRIGVSYMDRDYMITALKEGKPAISKLVMGKVLKSPVFAMVVPILDAQGKVVGALTGVINLGKPSFLDKITDSNYGKTGGYIINAPKQRLVITATDKRRVMEELPPRGANWLVDKFIEGYEGSGVVVNPLGVEVLASAKGIPIAGWYVVALLPTAEAFAPIRDMQQRMLLATLLLTLLAGGLTWWMLLRQLAPIEQAANAITRSGADIAPELLPNTTQDEIGQLIGGFNQLLKTLQQRDHYQRALLDNFPFAVWLKDTESRFLAVNAGFVNLFGAKSAAEFVGKTDYDISPGELAEGYRADDMAVLASRQKKNVEEEIDNAGMRKWFETYKAPVIDANGEVIGTVGFARDISDRKATEVALQSFTRDFEAFLDQTTDFVYFKDVDSRIRFCSQTMAVITGHRNWREMVGKHDREIFPSETAKIYEEEERPVIEDGRPLLDKVNPYYDAAGNTGYVQTNKWPLFDAEGKVVGIFGISRDITSRKRAEAELDRYREHLEDLVASRTNEATAAKEAAEAANIAKSAFLGSEVQWNGKGS